MTVDWDSIIQDLADLDEYTHIPDELDTPHVFASMIALSKKVVRLERQLEVLSDRVDWEKM